MKKINKTRYIQSILSAVVVALAAISLSCAQPDGSAIDGGLGGKGSIVLTASTGVVATDGPTGSVQRTILPSEQPKFSSYDVTFDNGEDEPITVTVEDVDDIADLEGDTGYVYILDAGEWTVTVTAYQDIEGTPQPAARGEETVTVAPGDPTPAAVNIAPLPITEGDTGIFTYKVDFPEDASGSLTLTPDGEDSYTPFNLVRGEEVSKPITPGYYDVSITLTNGAGLSAGLLDKLHVYSGLESKASFEFTDANFAKNVYLAGTLETLPAGKTLLGKGATITLSNNSNYSNGFSPVTTEVGPDGAWIVGVAKGQIGTGLLYIDLEAAGSDGKIYTGRGSTTSAVGATGAKGIELADTTKPGDVADFEAEAGDRAVTLTWTDPEDKDIDYIEITWTFGTGGSGSAKAEPDAEEYVAAGLTNGTLYKFTAKVVDTAELKSSEEGLTQEVNLPITGNVAGTTLQAAVNSAIAAGTELYLDNVNITGTGSTVDFTTADIKVKGKLSVSNSVTIKLPTEKDIAFEDDSAIELAYGAIGWYDESRFIGSAAIGGAEYLFTWDGSATDSKLTLKNRGGELSAGKINAATNASVAEGGKLVIAGGAELTVPAATTLTVGGELEVNGTITVAETGEIEVSGKYSLSSGATDANAGKVTVKAGGELVSKTDLGSGEYVVEAGGKASRKSDAAHFVGPATANPTEFVLNLGSFTYSSGSYTVEGDVNVANTYALDLNKTKLSVATDGKLTIPAGKILRLTNGAYNPDDPESIVSLEGVEGAQVVVTGGLHLVKTGVGANFFGGTSANITDGTGNDSAYNIVTQAIYKWDADADDEGNPGWKQTSAVTVDVEYTGPTDESITLSGITNGIVSWKSKTEVTVTASGVTGSPAYAWHLDGKAIDSATNASLALKPRELSVGDHVLTVFVTIDGSTYTESITFKVE